MSFIKKIVSATLALMTSLSMTISEARISKKPFTSTIMHGLEVDTIDTGGTLIFSDSPEYVKENGILYSDVVEGDARLLFYHLNDSNVNKKFAVIVENVSNEFNTIDITRGAIANPSDNFLKVGKNVMTDYMNDNFHNSIYMLKNDTKLFIESMDNLVLKPGQLIYGIYDTDGRTFQPILPQTK